MHVRILIVSHTIDFLASYQCDSKTTNDWARWRYSRVAHNMDVYSERRSTYSIHMQATCCCVSVTMVWVWRWSVMDMNTTANVIGGYKGKFHCQSCSKTVFSTQLMQTKQLIQRPSSVSIASSVAYTCIYIDGAPPSKQNQNICLPLHLAIRQTACTHQTLKCARARSLSLFHSLAAAACLIPSHHMRFARVPSTFWRFLTVSHYYAQ